MSAISQIILKGEEFFNSFVDQIQRDKIGDISVRRAVKKYDVKNLKIDNVTPLRAKKMYSTILPKYQTGVIVDKSWLQNERRLFIWCTLCYLYKKSIEVNDMKAEDFSFLSMMFPLKQMDLIKFQVYSLVKKDNKNCRWSAEEDQLLKKLVEKQFGKTIQWSNISKEFFSSSSQSFFRNAKQCRERWLNHLDPTKTKGKWELRQDQILLEQVLEKGKKWSRIVEALEGKKNQHMIKNRFKSLIHKKQKENKNKKLKENDIIKMILKDIESVKEKQGDEEQDSDQKMEQVSENQVSSEKDSQQNGQKENDQNIQKNSNWPIIVQSNSAIQIEKKEEVQKQSLKRNSITSNDIEVEVCGNKGDKQFVNNLFFNVNTPVADERIHSINLDSQSPSNIFMSPFPGSCWTPTIFILDDTQGQIGESMGLQDFSLTAQSTMKQFLKEEN